MELNKYLDVSPEAAEALREGRPVVALESTIISHGMPYPQNVETALAVEDIVRANGAVPATCCVIGGRLKAGCTKEQIEYLGRRGLDVPKASRRDLPVLLARGMDGATTVTTTMIADAIEQQLGVEVDRKRVGKGQTIKTAGLHKVDINIYREIGATVTVQVGKNVETEDEAVAEPEAEAVEEAVEAEAAAEVEE